jgi:hypothetical protein
MTVQELMERVGIVQTGRAIAYIKDGLDEMNMIAGTHINVERIDIVDKQRYYTMPMDAIKIIDIRCKHHNNSSSQYRSVPRSVHKPPTEDSDGI